MQPPRRSSAPSWFLPALVALAGIAAGFLLRGWVDVWPRYQTYSECVLHEMRGHPKNLTRFAIDLCREKVRAGEITEPKPQE